jgi:hypothetical protein
MKLVAMTRLKAGGQNLMRKAVGILAALSAATFLLAVVLHLDVRIPLGFAVLDEPPRPFAVVVEGLAGLLLTLGALPPLAARLGRGPPQPGDMPSPWQGWGGEWWP